MKLALLQENLKKGLARCAPAVASRGTLPVLSNVLLSTVDGRLRIVGNDLSLGISTLISAKVDEDGAITVPSKLLSDLIGNLPNDTVDLEVNQATQTLTIKCRGTKASIKGIEADEFPTMPSAADHEVVTTIPAELLAEAIGQVVVATASEHMNPALQGMLLHIEGDQVALAAIDGYRLAERCFALPAPATRSVHLPIPGPAMADVARTFASSEDPVSIAIREDAQVIFHAGGTEVVTRVIDAKFPDYAKFVPPDKGRTRTVANTAELIRALKRVALFAHSASEITTLQGIAGERGKPGRLELAAKASEIGEGNDQVDALVDDDSHLVACNVRYFLQALGVIDTEQVGIETGAAHEPLVIRPIGGGEYMHLVMPMRVP